MHGSIDKCSVSAQHSATWSGKNPKEAAYGSGLGTRLLYTIDYPIMQQNSIEMIQPSYTHTTIY